MDNNAYTKEDVEEMMKRIANITSPTSKAAAEQRMKKDKTLLALAMKAGAKAIRSNGDFIMADYVYDISGNTKFISFDKALQILQKVSDVLLESEEN